MCHTDNNCCFLDVEVHHVSHILALFIHCRHVRGMFYFPRTRAGIHPHSRGNVSATGTCPPATLQSRQPVLPSPRWYVSRPSAPGVAPPKPVCHGTTPAHPVQRVARMYQAQMEVVRARRPPARSVVSGCIPLLQSSLTLTQNPPARMLGGFYFLNKKRVIITVASCPPHSRSKDGAEEISTSYVITGSRPA